MASLRSSTLLPQCTSCVRRLTQQNLGTWSQTRNLSKKAKKSERHVIVRLLQDVPRFGRAGSYVPLNPSIMRNRWFPARIADYVPVTQLKVLQAQEVEMQRDVTFGVEVELEEEDDDLVTKKHYVRPIEIQVLSPERSMELIDTFVPATIDFKRQKIEQDRNAREQHGATGAADILTAAAMGRKAQLSENAIYGSVSTADVVATIKTALAHNDEAARVILNEPDVVFVSGHEEDDATRVKQLGSFKVEIRCPGATEAIVRTVRVRAKDMEA